MLLVMSTRSTKQKILDLLRERRLSPAGLRQHLGVSASVVHSHLKSLLDDGLIQKFGSAPRVFYKIREQSAIDVIEDSFVFQDSLGVLHTGMDGFRLWSDRGLKKMSFEDKVVLYVDRVSTMESNKRDGVFDLTGKLQKIVAVGEKIYLEEMVCLSLRTVRDFSRTKMGVYLDVVKNFYRKEIVEEFLDYAVPLIIAYAKKRAVNAVGVYSSDSETRSSDYDFVAKTISKRTSSDCCSGYTENSYEWCCSGTKNHTGFERQGI